MMKKVLGSNPSGALISIQQGSIPGPSYQKYDDEGPWFEPPSGALIVLQQGSIPGPSDTKSDDEGPWFEPTVEP
jgi:hypothetical protein